MTLVDTIVDLVQRKYSDTISVPPQPEQTFLLGNRYADYGLAILFALLFPLVRWILTRTVYEVSGLVDLPGCMHAAPPEEAAICRLLCHATWSLPHAHALTMEGIEGG
jgi:hypothetical protein